MSTTHYLNLTLFDPLVARDGRPFGIGQGNRMRGLSWLFPSVLAGAFRTALVKSGTGDFSSPTPSRLRQIAVAGPLPVADGQLYLPAPLDCLLGKGVAADGKQALQLFQLRPHRLGENEGVDFPEEADHLQPVLLSEQQSSQDFKPQAPPAWWPLDKYVQWLTTYREQWDSSWFDQRFLQAPLRQMRDHVSLDPQRGAALENRLFATANLYMSHLPRYGRFKPDAPRKSPLVEQLAPVSLSARVELPEDEPLPDGVPSLNDWQVWHPLGGERRLVHWQTADQHRLWQCPPEVKQALENAQYVRMVLVTPAIFSGGWKPGWLNSGLTGTFGGVKLELVGVCCGRWQAVSGWCLETQKPKPTRRMVPSGSVYFFRCCAGTAGDLAQQWLRSVCDDEQEQRDGFGLAVWGTWEPDSPSS